MIQDILIELPFDEDVFGNPLFNSSLLLSRRGLSRIVGQNFHERQRRLHSIIKHLVRCPELAAAQFSKRSVSGIVNGALVELLSDVRS